jgi:hypothetical protein
MNRNVLYLVFGGLAVVSAVIGYQLYQERQKTTGVEISIGQRGHFHREEVVQYLADGALAERYLGKTICDFHALSHEEA